MVSPCCCRPTQLLTPEQEEAFGQALVDLVATDVDRVFQMEETFPSTIPMSRSITPVPATIPAFQGRGIGSTFLAEMLQRADSEGMPAYHEATALATEPSTSVTATWRMWREP